MSPLSSLTNMAPSQSNVEGANPVQDQSQDPSLARFADILRQRQGASPPPGKAAKEAPPPAISVDAGKATDMATEVSDGGGDPFTDLVSNGAVPGVPLDPTQLPPMWTAPLAAHGAAVPETLATSILAQRNQADGLATAVAGRTSDQPAKPLEAGAGNSASRGIEVQTGNARSARADSAGLRTGALQVGERLDQAAATTPAGASAATEGRPNGSAFDVLLARTDTITWGVTPPTAETGATRNAAPLAHSVSIEARVGTPRFADETAQQVTWLAKNGIEHAEIRVKPAELGPISVRIEMQNNEAVISFAVTQPETRVAVEDALHRLQEMLAESGISMGETSVGGHSFGQQLHDERDSGRGRNLFAAPADTRAGALEGMVRPAPAAARGLVDTFA